MSSLQAFLAANKVYVEAAQAISSIVNIIGWCVGAILLCVAIRRGSISSVTLGPIAFRMKEEAVKATTAALRDYNAKSADSPVDVPKVRATIEKAFDPGTADKLIGKCVLWVDDNPDNNTLVVRALRRLQLDVQLETTTELGLEAMRRRNFDLVISDMGRGTNMVAGYDLLKAIRDSGSRVPFLIFAGSDSPEFRREAAERGAQLSTNNMLELMDHIIKYLSK